MDEILLWNRYEGGSLRLNTWGGPVGHGRPNSCLNVFTAHGWGYGLMLLDRVQDFLLFTLAEAAHGYTRGTWTATEDSTLDRRQWNNDTLGDGSGYCSPSQTLLPTMVKWLLLFEDPRTKTLWIARATPRSWLEVGKTISVGNATSRYGRISFRATATTATRTHASISLPTTPGWTPPPGGIVLRLRHHAAAKLSGVTVGGAAWPSINATAETITFTAAELAGAGAAAKLAAIVASY